MIKEAKENGADLVKFQLYNAEDDRGKPHYEFSKQAELSFDQAKMLFDYGKEIGIEVFFSVFDVERVEWCEKIGVKRYKIACGMREPLVLKMVKETKKEVIISVSDKTHTNISILWDWLYCVPIYPAIITDMPLFNNPYVTFKGFSDHTVGIDAAKIALARGALIIEKHFTVDRRIGYEAEWSMIPEELKELKRWENVCKEVL